MRSNAVIIKSWWCCDINILDDRVGYKILREWKLLLEKYTIIMCYVWQIPKLCNVNLIVRRKMATKSPNSHIMILKTIHPLDQNFHAINGGQN